MLRPKALDHVGILVSDLERSVRFYAALGVVVLRRREGAAVLKIGDQEINMFSVPDLAAASRDQAHGLDHFCLEMDSATIDDLVVALSDAGIEIVRGPTERRDGAAVFLRDPDGVRVELQVKNRG
jgi:catechol 2,3-dioxygenase-like lactoylglutathione lyase family enzyme